MAAPAAPPPRTSRSTRTQEEHETLWKLYIVEGRSASECAKIMRSSFGTGDTRNAVVGYAYRQQWPERAAGGPGRPVNSSPVVKPPSVGKERPAGPRAALLPDLDPIVGQREEGGVIYPVFERSCRFPVGPSPRFRMSEQLFCGEPAALDMPYCRRCAGRAYGADGLARREKAYAAKN